MAGKLLLCGHCLADDHASCMGEMCSDCEVCASRTLPRSTPESELTLRSTTDITATYEVVDAPPDPFRFKPSIAEQLVWSLDKMIADDETGWVKIAECASVSTAHGVKDRLLKLRPGFEITTRRLKPGSGNRIPTAMYAKRITEV